MDLQKRVPLLLLSALLCATQARAQTPDAGGLSIAVGAGAGWARVSCDVCQTARDLGPSAFLNMGTMVRPGVRVGGEATFWTHEVEDEREHMGAAMAVLYLHPRQGPLYLKGGVGYVGYRAGDDIALNTIGMQVGAGYELRLGGLALNNFANLISSGFGSLENEGTTIAEDVSTTLLQLGVGITLR
jgi:hypothetical protein